MILYGNVLYIDPETVLVFENEFLRMKIITNHNYIIIYTQYIVDKYKFEGPELESVNLSDILDVLQRKEYSFI